MSTDIPLTDLHATVASAVDSAEQLELSSIHDFATKLTQPAAIDALKDYVKWQVALRAGETVATADSDPNKEPDYAPLSINLDLIHGTGNKKIAAVADSMDGQDWVRLSLDLGTDPTFQAMHNPRKAFKLEDICAAVPEIKAANPALTVGFSYIVTWQGANINDTNIVENLHEIAQAAKLAKRQRGQVRE